MKNFKLLLASTAILSMGVLTANASNDYNMGTINFTANATFVQPITVSDIYNLNFGVLSGAVKGDTVTVSTDGAYTKTGTVTLLQGTETIVGNFTVSNSLPYQQAYDDCNEFAIVIPDVELKNGNTYCGYVSDFKIDGTGFGENRCTSDGGETYCWTSHRTGMDGTHNIGATLYIDDHSGGSTLSSVPVGHCTANVTATIMYTAY